MWNALRTLDSVLRGEATAPARLRLGRVDIPIGGLSSLLILLAAFYGLCMGWFALFNHAEPEYQQLAASALKVPALFTLTLLVTFPSLYVFNALVGSRLGLLALLRLLVASLAVTVAILASFGPIVAFFSLTTSSYAFMVLFNVALYALAGLLGLGFLLQTLSRIASAMKQENAVSDSSEAPSAGDASAGALERIPGSVLTRNVKTVFACWLFVFGLVGMQMSWVLRPFIGSPDRPFEWFRERQSNFFEAVSRALFELFS
jgi:hypothetical protein